MRSHVQGFLVITYPYDAIVPIEIAGDGAALRAAPIVDTNRVDWEQAQPVTLAELLRLAAPPAQERAGKGGVPA